MGHLSYSWIERKENKGRLILTWIKNDEFEIEYDITLLGRSFNITLYENHLIQSRMKQIELFDERLKEKYFHVDIFTLYLHFCHIIIHVI